ncbi:UDP-glycosyltransferase [Quillaja saponaria]|uniref:UDP-glycosyltransferase n=1 Tax=Quillaja saponaria TaxID=32244 RepID=A0AAD7QC41_QUISA|nr:UDP-glycosyltransferase [Quillaja saponaria]
MVSSTTTTTTTQHILIYPFPTSGHIIPILDLTNQLLTRGHLLYVTVLVTPQNLPLLQPFLATHPSSLQYFLLPPPQYPNPNRNKLIAQVQNMRQLHYPLILQWFHSHPSQPVAIISDFFIGWTHQLASDLRIPRLVFSPSGVFALSIALSVWHDLPENTDPDNSNFTLTFPKFPNSPVYHWWQIPHLYREGRKGDPDWEFFRENFVANLESWGMVFNSFTELERVYFDHLKKELGHDRVWAVGPVLPPSREDNNAGPDPGPTNRGGSSSVPCDEVLTWLDARSEYSVVYVCFGSRTVLTIKQMEVLTVGLERSGVHFILSVIGPDAGGDHGVIPEDFEECVKGRGLVIKGWAPQVPILRHPAVGGFMTHCGWNSVLEGLAAGVVMLTWPMSADQFTNAKLLVEQLGVAIQGGEGTQIIPESGELAQKFVELVDGSKPERVRVRKLRDAAMDAVKEGGSSNKELAELIKRLSELQNAK